VTPVEQAGSRREARTARAGYSTRWAHDLSEVPPREAAVGDSLAPTAAAFSPCCEVEARLADAVDGAPVAFGFDLAAHLQRVAMVVNRCR
jgi:hypothetical protein